MAVVWQYSNIPYFDTSTRRLPLVGAQAYFYDAGTVSGKSIYADSGLTIGRSQPVLANENGMWTSVYLAPGDYRFRAYYPGGTDILFDVDGITIPAVPTSGEDPEDTSLLLLARTGDLKHRYSTGAHSGWVRANGRTIGSASSGATERADLDCEDLFLLLWAADSALTVSGGRGASAANDWAANKTIALPNIRGRTLAGLAGMGNTVSTVIDPALIDGAVGTDTLGAKAGDDQVAITLAQMAVHAHGGVTGLSGAHNHINGAYDKLMKITGVNTIGAGADPTPNEPDLFSADTILAAPDHTHTIASAGSGDAHINLQPTIFVTVYIKT